MNESGKKPKLELTAAERAQFERELEAANDAIVFSDDMGPETQEYEIDEKRERYFSDLNKTMLDIALQGTPEETDKKQPPAH